MKNLWKSLELIASVFVKAKFKLNIQGIVRETASECSALYKNPTDPSETFSNLRQTSLIRSNNNETSPQARHKLSLHID